MHKYEVDCFNLIAYFTFSIRYFGESFCKKKRITLEEKDGRCYNMIIVSLHCQMGNQMFQYAFGKAIAKRLHTFFIPFQSDPYYPFKLQYFKLDVFTRLVYSHPKITKQYHRICRKLIKHVFKKHITEEECKTVPNTGNHAYYYGFFQSEQYFSAYAESIKKSFIIKKQYKKQFESKYRKLIEDNKVIVVHLRRADYNEVEFDGLGGQGVSIPMEYYHKALAAIKNKSEYQILFISDDIESVKRDFGNEPNYRFEENSAIVDFQLIQHADIAIIANSTFAWWAGYLSEKINPLIIAPKYWLGFKIKKEYPQGIYTPKFNWVNVL